ncbi:hypothetical protein FRC18_002744 [Serendipita sp. 400]|nr:hypothetical protein FRC18_002744 [Serendipita sp. 400]
MSQASVHSGSSPSVDDPLFKVRLLAALRNGDPSSIIPLITDISKNSRGSLESPATDAGSAALHLAIRCATCDTILLLLQQRAISPNAVDPETGATALHLASAIGRADVVSLLLEQDEIDDTVRDPQGKTCLEVAKTRDVARIIKESRSLLNANYLSLLRLYIMSPKTTSAPEALLKLLKSPRIRSVDLNQFDASSGSTLLHEAVRRKDLQLIELAVRVGADVFVRDKRGRGLMEIAGKDDRTKVYLRQFTNQDTTLLEPANTQTEEPTMRGYLTKYGNMAKGYNTRWFVLKDGMLSYYRHQDDENLACRGSLSMRNARVKPSSADRLKFEIYASTRNGEGTPERWYMKANHAVEVSRWVQALQRAIDWNKKGKGVDSDSMSLASANTDQGTMYTSSSGKKRSSRSTGSAVFTSFRRSKHERAGSTPSLLQPPPSLPVDEAGTSDDEDSWNELTSRTHPPHQDAVQLVGNTTSTHVDLALQLLDASGGGGHSEETQVTLRASLTQAKTMLSEYSKMVTEREEWFRAQIARERERASIWEDSLQKVVQQGAELEEELKKTIRQNKDQRRRSRLFNEQDNEATIRPKSGRTNSISVAAEVALAPTLSPVGEKSPVPAGLPPSTPAASDAVVSASPSRVAFSSPRQRVPSKQSIATDSDSDEFFDAIEANALPNMHIPEQLKSHSLLPVQDDWIDSSRFEAYQNLRTRLGLEKDNRPPVSLWSVLKGSIGKDLTRISFPVFFNESTSMLQRMAEDMEFSECRTYSSPLMNTANKQPVDTAAKESDPYLRIAYIAAFAMSNYSSTIGRIAKPFNPCLSETFEYVRLDKRYTYISEKVIHQPPVTACMAQSPDWQYYGEVDAKNKFSGKSFEIRPTGMAHVDLKLPREWAPAYPAVPGDPSKSLEHYSWKKVITNVSGFILGSPTIDHYGEMTITNHRTMDQCILTFKPRGWKAKDSFEITGKVFNSRGESQYDIAGRWNSQLVARKTGNYTTDLLPDVTVGHSASEHASPEHEYILLWRNSEKPPAPFNLTPFAITLNDCPPSLKPQLPPTDCRLRPDQRAFELGQYELANELKSQQEEFQRATRRKREAGLVAPHKPRWFEAKTEPDTGERVWAPRMKGNQLEYWWAREQVVKSLEAGNPIEWPDVDHIYIDAKF